MKTLQIDEKEAKKLFKNASAEFKQILVDTFGEKFFSEKITDRVKTFEDACEIKGINPLSLFHPSDTKDEIAYKKIKIIAEVLNEGWKPDWTNHGEYKYYPYFEMNKTGFGFSYYFTWRTATVVGSRLTYKSSELATYAGTKFKKLYKEYMVI